MRQTNAFLFSRALMRRVFALGAAVLLFAALVPVHSARADDPFDFTSGDWMSFNRYKEDPQAWKKEQEEKAAAPLAPPVVLAPQPVIPPIRPVVAPVMPGLNSGFDVKVDSTADDTTSAAHLTHLEDNPDLQLPPTSWQNAKQAAKNGLQTRKEGEETPLDVRLTYLPQQPAAKHPKKAKKEEAPVKAAQAPAPPAADAVDRAAVDAYKKRQLEAIESDRQTLKALQDAIAQLGLQKELNFMTGASGSVNNTSAPAPLVDLPPVTPPASN